MKPKYEQRSNRLVNKQHICPICDTVRGYPCELGCNTCKARTERARKAAGSQRQYTDKTESYKIRRERQRALAAECYNLAKAKKAPSKA